MKGQPIKVVAIGRNETRHFRSVMACVKEYGFRTKDELLSAIVNNRTWVDGFTTFDFDVDVSDEVVAEVTAHFKYKREIII